MNKKLIYYFALINLIMMGCAGNSKLDKCPETVDQVDLQKYAGKWYEIARFDHSFERGMVGVTATYTILPNGEIEVLNEGYQNSFHGKLKSVKGKARIPDLSKPGRLKVSFFWFFESDYLILELDQKEYQYVLISGSSKNYLWILSRTPQMNKEVYDMLVEKAKLKAFPVEKILLVPQQD